MSIRLRLTLLFSVILALTLVVFSTALYVAQAHSTLADIEGKLLHQAEGMARNHGLPPEAGHGAPGSSQGGGTAAATSPGSALPGRWTQIRGIDGTITGQTADLSGANLPLGAPGLQFLQSGADGAGWFETATVQGETLLVYSQRFVSAQGTAAILQVAFPITQALQSLTALRLALLIGSGFATAAAFALGWILAGVALRPIHRITQTAHAIGAEHDFSRRVAHRGPNDEVGQLALTFNDMLDALENAYRRLESSLESQRRFVADASHELRTPLTTVRGNIGLLEQAAALDAQERGEIIADTRDEVDRLIRLINQLLALARSDAGQQLRHEPVPVAPLLEDIYRQTRLLAPERTIVCASPAEVEALGDRDALKQALLILVDNANAHSGPGAAISITAEPENDQVAISVEDTGPGIAPEVLPHIFERFYRGSISRTGRGTGLGLAIAQELVTGQGGSLTVQSRPGQGSKFTVTLAVC